MENTEKPTHQHTNLAGDPTHHAPDQNVSSKPEPVPAPHYVSDRVEENRSNKGQVASLLTVIVLLVVVIGFLVGSKYMSNWNPMTNDDTANDSGIVTNDPTANLPTPIESDVGTKYKQVAKINPITKYVNNIYMGDDIVSNQVVISSDSSLVDSAKYNVAWNTQYTDRYVFYINRDNQMIYYYDKDTNTKRALSLPDGVNINDVEFADLGLYVMTNKWVMLHFFKKDGYGTSNTYFLNTDNFEYYSTEVFDNCDAAYCYGASLELEISSDEFITHQGGGDACGGGGIIARYNAATKAYTKILDYDSGCADENDEYIGLYKNLLVHSKHFWDEGDEGDWDEPDYSGPSVIYLEVATTDIYTKEKQVLISEKDMPKNIQNVVLNTKDGLIGLFETYDLESPVPVKVYDMNAKKFTNANFKNENTLYDRYDNNLKVQKLLEDNKSFIKITQENVEYARVVRADNTYGEYTIRGMDQSGTQFDLLKDPDKIFNNNSEVTKQNYAFSLTNKPWVKSDHEVEFYVNLRQWGETSNPIMWAQDKKMLLNTQTGVIYEEVNQ
jgi:hypothetical protein